MQLKPSQMPMFLIKRIYAAQECGLINPRSTAIQIRSTLEYRGMTNDNIRVIQEYLLAADMAAA